MTHYHVIDDDKTSLGIVTDGGHNHKLPDGEMTDTTDGTEGHVHTAPDGTLTGIAIPIVKQAFSDVQRGVSGMFGHEPEDIYLEAFADLNIDLHLLKKKVALILMEKEAANSQDPKVFERYYNLPKVTAIAKQMLERSKAIRKSTSS